MHVVLWFRGFRVTSNIVFNLTLSSVGWFDGMSTLGGGLAFFKQLQWLQVNICIKKKKICKIVDFAAPANHRIKLKECEKRDKYLDLARELKKLWNMAVTIIPIVIGAFGTVTKGLLKIWKLVAEWRSSKQQHYWKQPEYWEESWRFGETCCHSISSERPSANADVKNSNE